MLLILLCGASAVLDVTEFILFLRRNLQPLLYLIFQVIKGGIWFALFLNAIVQGIVKQSGEKHVDTEFTYGSIIFGVLLYERSFPMAVLCLRQDFVSHHRLLTRWLFQLRFPRLLNIRKRHLPPSPTQQAKSAAEQQPEFLLHWPLRTIPTCGESYPSLFFIYP